jgi:hypothetical protein
VTVALALLVSGCGNDSEPPTPPAAGNTAVEQPAQASESLETAVAGRVPVVPGGVPTVVVLEPRTPREFPPQVQPPVMDQISLTFTPGIIFARTGQPAEFRNSDDVLHNVRVRSEATREGTFNVAIPTGGAYTFTFEQEGFYDVGCDIHPGMAAMVVVSSTPYVTLADAEGRFGLPGVAPGSYRLMVYAGVDTIERPVEVGAGRTEVDATAR